MASKARRVPELKTEMIAVEYWACNIEGHRHREERTALACIAKDAARKPRTTRWTPATMAEALARWQGGESKASIGRSYGIGGQRMSQVLYRADRDAFRRDHPGATLEEYWRARPYVKRKGGDGNE